MELVQYKRGKRSVHGKAETVSELIAFYYQYRKQHGAMTVEDTSDNRRTVATLGSA